MKIHQVGAELNHVDTWMGGQTYIETDRHDKDKNNFLQVCKCAYKGENCAV